MIQGILSNGLPGTETNVILKNKLLKFYNPSS